MTDIGKALGAIVVATALSAVGLTYVVCRVVEQVLPRP